MVAGSVHGVGISCPVYRCSRRFNLIDDGLVGQQIFAGEATRLAYGTEEAKEGREAFVQKRAQDFSSFPWHF